MNGYPTDFGITECINLCASSKLADKRVAYLGLTILVDETESILMLMTNLLKQDLNNLDIEIISLALNFLGDIANGEMLRELMPDIEKHLQSPNPLIRKKTGLVAVRAIRKLPPEDTVNILNFIPSYFDTPSSAVHLSGAALVTALCVQDEAHAATLALSTVPTLLSILEEHAMGHSHQNASGPYDTAHETGNPFVVAKLLSALRIILTHAVPNEAVVEQVTQMLFVIVNKFDHSKVIGCAVLYDCVRLTSTLRSQPNVQDMVIHILLNFLGHQDATIRYIALKELAEFGAENAHVLSEISALEEKLLAALRDADPTVRTQAVKLAFRVTNGNNIEQILKELGDYVRRSDEDDSEAIEDACEKMFLLADEHVETDEGKVDAFITAILLGHQFISNKLIAYFYSFLAARPSVRARAVRALYDRVICPGTSEVSQRDSFSCIASSDISDKTATQAKRRPRCEILALQIIGEYADVALEIGIPPTELVTAFEIFAKIRDDCYTGSEDPIVFDKKRSYKAYEAVGEAAITGLLKIAVRTTGNLSTMVAHANFGDVLDLEHTLNGIDVNSTPLLQPVDNSPFLQHPVTSATDDLLALVPFDENVLDKKVVVYNGDVDELFDFDILNSNSNITMQQKQKNTGPGAEVFEQVRFALSKFTTSKNLEQQQRACEYIALLDAGVEIASRIAARSTPMAFESVRAIVSKSAPQMFNCYDIRRDNSIELLVDLMDEGKSMVSQPIPVASEKSGIASADYGDQEDPLAALRALSLISDQAPLALGMDDVLAITMGEETSPTGDIHENQNEIPQTLTILPEKEHIEDGLERHTTLQSNADISSSPNTSSLL